MIFGSKAGPGIRADLKKSTGNSQFLSSVKDGKDLRVRFLQNPEDWYKFKEHFSKSTNFFPCTQDSSCPGCSAELRASKRYVASVLDVAQAKVIPLKMPLDLANRVTNKCDRNGGTLLDRDFTLIRTGKGMEDTTYDVEAEDKTQVDLSRYEILDHEGIVASMYEDAFGSGQTVQPEPVAMPNSPSEVARLQAELASLQARKAEEAPKVVESGPVTMVAPDTTTTSTPTIMPITDSPEPMPTTGGDDDVISLETLNAMGEEQLHKLCVTNDLTPPMEAKTAEQIRDWLLAEFGVE